MIKNILFTDVFPTLEKLNERKDESNNGKETA